MARLRMFENYIGIDYSGADTPVKRNSGLQDLMAGGEGKTGRTANAFPVHRPTLGSEIDGHRHARSPRLGTPEKKQRRNHAVDNY